MNTVTATRENQYRDFFLCVLPPPATHVAWMRSPAAREWEVSAGNTSPVALFVFPEKVILWNYNKASTAWLLQHAPHDTIKVPGNVICGNRLGAACEKQFRAARPRVALATMKCQLGRKKVGMQARMFIPTLSYLGNEERQRSFRISFAHLAF